MPPEAAGKPVEVWFTDEARVGQQGTLTRVWAKRGSRPRALRDRRFEWAYLFGAICPERSVGAAIVMPEVNIAAMNEHLAEISRRVSVGAIALLVLDGAGWHSSPRLEVPDNIALLPLPPYAPELNPMENVWEFLRGNYLSHRVWDGCHTLMWVLRPNAPPIHKGLQTSSRYGQVICNGSVPTSPGGGLTVHGGRCRRRLGPGQSRVRPS